MRRDLVLEKRKGRPPQQVTTLRHNGIQKARREIPRKPLAYLQIPIVIPPADIMLRMKTAERVALVTGLVIIAGAGTLRYASPITESEAAGIETTASSHSVATPIPEITRSTATAAAAIEKEKPPLTIDILRPFGDEGEFARFSKKYAISHGNYANSFAILPITSTREEEFFQPSIELIIKNGRVFAGRERVSPPIFDDIAWRLREKKTALRDEFNSCKTSEIQWLRQMGYRIDRMTGTWFGRNEYGDTVYWIRGKKPSGEGIYATHQIQEITIKVQDGACVPIRREPYYSS